MTEDLGIAERLAQQRERLRRAAQLAGRDADRIVLVAVSKKHSVEAILRAYAAGQRDFGENYVQELVAKAEQLSQYTDIRWHMIGHLQSNKVRLAVPLVHCVHTVSSEKLACELAQRVGKAQAHVSASPDFIRPLPLSVLVEVNVSGESQKSGCQPQELAQLLDVIASEETLSLKGLMTMPPFDADPERARPYFDALQRLREEHGGSSRLPELSMGMSHDLEVAVQAGATIVRVGSAIFGERS